MENDYIMRQIKLIGEGIAMVLKKKTSTESLGEVQKEDGSLVPREVLISEYLAENKVSEAVTLVNALKYKMSAYDFQGVSQWFMGQLKEYQAHKPSSLSQNDLERYQLILDDLL